MILPEWETALRLHQRRRARVNWEMYDALIQACLDKLRNETSDLLGLRAHFGRGSFWALQLARRMYPSEPPLSWDPHLFADVAYGMRWRELSGAADQPLASAEDGDDDA